MFSNNSDYGGRQSKILSRSEKIAVRILPERNVTTAPFLDHIYFFTEGRHPLPNFRENAENRTARPSLRPEPVPIERNSFPEQFPLPAVSRTSLAGPRICVYRPISDTLTASSARTARVNFRDILSHNDLVRGLNIYLYWYSAYWRWRTLYRHPRLCFLSNFASLDSLLMSQLVPYLNFGLEDSHSVESDYFYNHEVSRKKMVSSCRILKIRSF